MISTYDFLRQEAISHLNSVNGIIDHLKKSYQETGDPSARQALESLGLTLQMFKFAGQPGTDKNLNPIEDGPTSLIGKPESKPRTNLGGRPKMAGTVISKAFVYEADDKSIRLSRLCEALKALGWIDYDTDAQTFIDLFSGGDTRKRVVWTGGANVLATMFKRLVNERQLVSLPKGHSLWVMVNGHFWNKERRVEFGTDKLRNTHAPKNDEQTIAYMVALLDPDCTEDELRELMMSQR